MPINPSTPNLKQFLLRQKVLHLYRDILRTVRQIPDKDNQKYLLDWARTDFKQNKHCTDEYAIKRYINHGETMLNELRQSLSMCQ